MDDDDVRVRESRFVQADGGPFISATIRYEPNEEKFGNEVTQFYRTKVFTAGNPDNRIVNNPLVLNRVDFQNHVSQSRYPAELWERVRKKGNDASFNELRDSRRWGFEQSVDDDMPPLVPTEASPEFSPWPVRTWIAATFLDRAKQVVTETIRLGIPNVEGMTDRTGVKDATPSLTKLFDEFVDTRAMGGINTDDPEAAKAEELIRSRLTFRMAVSFTTMVDVLVDYTDAFVESHDNRSAWTEEEAFKAIIDNIMQYVMGPSMDSKNHDKSLKSIVERELARYPDSASNLMEWANKLNLAHAALVEEKAGLFQNWIYFAELTAFLKRMVNFSFLPPDTYPTIRERVRQEGLMSNWNVSASLLVSRFRKQANADTSMALLTTPMDSIDYLETQIMRLVMKFYRDLWSKHSDLWENSTFTLVASDDFTTPYLEYGNRRSRSDKRKRVFDDLGSLSSILEDLAVIRRDPHQDGSYASQLHKSRADIGPFNDQQHFSKHVGKRINLKTLEKKSEEEDNLYAKAILSDEPLRFWTPYPETQPFLLYRQNWNNADVDKPWLPWHRPIGITIREMNREVAYEDATPIPTMNHARVAIVYDRASDNALVILHGIVLDYLIYHGGHVQVGEKKDERKLEDISRPTSGDEEYEDFTISCQPFDQLAELSPEKEKPKPRTYFRPDRIARLSMTYIRGEGNDVVKLPEEVDEVDRYFKDLLEKKTVWLSRIRQPEEDHEFSELGAFQRLENSLNVAYIALRQKVLDRGILQDDGSAILYKPSSHLDHEAISGPSRRAMYDRVEEWFAQFTSTASTMIYTIKNRAVEEDEERPSPAKVQEQWDTIISLYVENSALASL